MIRTSVAVALAFSIFGPAVADPGTWEPAKTHVLMAGVLEWQDKNLSPFPKKDRKDRVLESKFKEAGVPAGQIVFLEDAQATQKAMQQELRKLAEAAPEGSTFVFYYAGHGMQDDGGEVYLANHDADTGKKKGLRDGEAIWVENEIGRKVKGRLKLTQAIHPEGLGIAACAGHWGNGMPVAKGKGVFFNDCSNWTGTTQARRI